MLTPILAGFTAFLISFIFLPLVIRFSRERKLLAHPGKRRIHKRMTPSLGGVAIFFGFNISSICWSLTPNTIIFQLLPLLTIPFLIGVLDDLFHLKPLAKLIAQSVTGALLFFILDLTVVSSYGLLGEYPFSPPVSFAATLFVVIFITNAFNLIDGVDGLAATFSLMAASIFGVWFQLIGAFSYATVCFALCGAIFAFLFQNWEPSKIFMGDTGSLFIGTLLSTIVILFLNENHALDKGHSLKFDSSVGTAVCFMIIPLVDTLRIIIVRINKSVSPFSPDKRHIHHALVRLNLGHRRTVYILAIAHLIFIGIALLMRAMSDWYVLGVAGILATMLCWMLDRMLAKSIRAASARKRTPLNPGN